jgi:hypothetical protein
MLKIPLLDHESGIFCFTHGKKFNGWIKISNVIRKMI